MMTQTELVEKFNLVRKRHNVRQLVVIIISFTILFEALLSIDTFMLTDTGRQIYVYSVAVIFAVAAIFGSIFNYQQDKKDCFTHQFTCPHCGKHLYEWHRLMLGGESPEKSGKCGHCQADLILKVDV